MRHRVAGKKLSRNRNQRKALFKNLINSLILHGQIRTTEAKAKAIRRLVDKLINKGKQQTLHSQRLIAAFLQNKKAMFKITNELGPLFKKRTSGFTRMIRLGQRRGDGAPIVRLELVEKPVEKPPEKPAKKSKDENQNTRQK